MQRTNKSYFSEDLCTAPEYYLAKNIGKELPRIEPDTLKSQYLDSLAEVSAFQIFEDIPGIRKNRITIDATTLFEIWEPILDRILLVEDLNFLRIDQQRIDTIVAKLTWLGNSWLSAEILNQKMQVDTWEEVLDIATKYDYEFDIITVDYRPAQIVLEIRNNQSQQTTEYWGVYPSGWEIFLHKTRAFNGGYIIDDYNTPYKFKIEVWTGIPFFRNIQNGEIVTIENFY